MLQRLSGSQLSQLYESIHLVKQLQREDFILWILKTDHTIPLSYMHGCTG